jgi:hypothetical protein
MTTIKIRRDTAANWTANNPVLATGEPGLETDTKKVKYGNGSTAWNSLNYPTVGVTSYNDLTNKPTSFSGTITNYNEGTPYSLGTTNGTINPDCANGNVQTITLNGNFTFNSFNNPITGQSMTLIIKQDSTGSRTLTSSMLFSGGNKTLSTAGNSVDILSVFFDGTTYYASLGKDFK